MNAVGFALNSSRSAWAESHHSLSDAPVAVTQCQALAPKMIRLWYVLTTHYLTVVFIDSQIDDQDMP